MNPFDEDDEGDISIGERSAAERDITPEIPKAPSVRTFEEHDDFRSAKDVDQDTLRAFIACVIYANVAVLLVALGPMVWYFEGWSRIGPALLAVGLLAGVRTYLTYRAWDRSRDSNDGDDDTPETSDDDTIGNSEPHGSDGPDTPEA